MYFYNEEGDRLFQEIMKLDEYYLTRSEIEIFNDQAPRINALLRHQDHFRLIELGAGDGSKTKIVLRHLLEDGAKFSYSPIDISANVLQILKANLTKELPDLDIETLAGDYFTELENLSLKETEKKVIFFLGSNIGNFINERAINFLKSVRQNLNKGDKFVIGVDLKKDPKRILAAYNDRHGVTKAFNLNLLRRINEELGANFNIDQFDHNPVYDPMTGECRSYLISKEDQSVYLQETEEYIHFEKWETLFMEVSKKYAPSELELLAEKCGFKVVEHLFDKERLYTDSFWEAV